MGASDRALFLRQEPGTSAALSQQLDRAPLRWRPVADPRRG